MTALVKVVRYVSDCDVVPISEAMPRADALAILRTKLCDGTLHEYDTTFVVKPNRANTRLYAMQLISAPPRLMQSGDVAKLELEYTRGVVYQLTESDRLPAEEVEKISRVYGRCLYCGRGLKAATSVQRGIGPVRFKRVS